MVGTRDAVGVGASTPVRGVINGGGGRGTAGGLGHLSVRQLYCS